jgi:hypothetical protein
MAVSYRLNPELNPILQLLGAYLVLDDIDDLGKLDRIHHWQIGAAMVLATILPPLTISGDDSEEP